MVNKKMILICSMVWISAVCAIGEYEEGYDSNPTLRRAVPMLDFEEIRRQQNEREQNQKVNLRLDSRGDYDDEDELEEQELEKRLALSRDRAPEEILDNSDRKLLTNKENEINAANMAVKGLEEQKVLFLTRGIDLKRELKKLDHDAKDKTGKKKKEFETERKQLDRQLSDLNNSISKAKINIELLQQEYENLKQNLIEKSEQDLRETADWDFVSAPESQVLTEGTLGTIKQRLNAFKDATLRKLRSA